MNEPSSGNFSLVNFTLLPSSSVLIHSSLSMFESRPRSFGVLRRLSARARYVVRMAERTCRLACAERLVANDYAEWRSRFARVCLDLFVAVRFAPSFLADFATRSAAISFFTRASVVLFDSFLGVFLLIYARCHQLENNNVRLWTLPTMCLNSIGEVAQTQFVGIQPTLPVHRSSMPLTSRRRLRARRSDSLRDTRPGIYSAYPNLLRAAIWSPPGCRASNDGTRQRAESGPAGIVCQFPGPSATALPKPHALRKIQRN